MSLLAKFAVIWVRSALVVTRGAVPLVLLGVAASGQALVGGETPRATQDRVTDPNWWPTKSTPPLKAYAGVNACRECHSEETSSQMQTPMAQASFRGKEFASSATVASAAWRNGAYLYRLSSDKLGTRLTVGSGNQTVAADVSWIFGAGVHGQTYIFENKNNFYESQVSSYSSLHGMGLTPGHAPIEAGDLKNALGERLSGPTAALCFGCHTTYSSTSSRLDASQAIPGVHCEACHGPGTEHIRLITVGQIDDASKAILNPAHLGPVELVDFCGACHRTTMDVVVSGEAYGPINVRFQPYRLEKSRCWGTRGDPRLTCVACHNPHKPLVREAGAYDSRCLGCHRAPAGASPVAAAPYSICPKASANCTACHMPKYDVPGMHAKFTDHFIRIVRAGESYPN